MIVFFRGRRVPIILVVVISTRCLSTVTGFKKKRKEKYSVHIGEKQGLILVFLKNRKFDNVTKFIHILVLFFEKNVIIPIIFGCSLFWLGLFF